MKKLCLKIPNQKKKTDIQVQKEQWVSNKINPNKPIPRHIIIKVAKVKERILKAARDKQRVNYKGTSIRLSADFFVEIYRPEGDGMIHLNS